MIELSNLAKRFGAVQAVEDVSLSANDGEITGVLGPNGAGKTTTLRMLYGLLRPDRGHIRVDGGLGVLPDSRGLYDRLTVRENVRYFGRLQGLSGADLEARIDRLLDVLELSALADRRTHGFSHGERVKVAIARALVHDPQNVVLDEPTTGLDVSSTRSMRRFLKGLAAEGRCVLFSSHIMQEVTALTDRIRDHRARPRGSRRDTVRAARGHRHDHARRRVPGHDRLGRGSPAVSRSPVRVVFAKELTDGLRDRRSLFSALLFGPLFGPIVFSVVLTTTLRLEQERAEQTLAIPVQGAERAPNLIRFLESNGARVEPAPLDPIATMKAEVVDLVLVIPPEFPDQFRGGEPADVELIVDRSRRASQTSIQRTTSLLAAYGHQIGRLRLEIRGIDPSTVDALVVSEHDLSTPQSRGALLFAMLPYLVMMSIFIGSMYLAIDCTAGERERRSLEPLLINPVPRSLMMTGKLLATTLLGVVSLTLTVTTFAVAISFIPAGELGLELRLDPSTSVLLFLVALPVTLVASSLQTIVAAFTKSFREAQTYVSLLLLVPMIPSFWLMIFPVKAKLWMMLVPLLAQNVLIDHLVRGEGVELASFALSTVSTVVSGLLLWGVSAGLYRREGLLFTE